MLINDKMKIRKRYEIYKKGGTEDEKIYFRL